MDANSAPTDFNEPLMAEYLRQHILDCEGPRIRALWASGFGWTLPGLTTYAPNCIERQHRTVKGLMPGQHWDRDLSKTMLAVCASVAGKLKRGHYANLGAKVAKLPPGLFTSGKRNRRAKAGEWFTARAGSDDELCQEEAQAPMRLLVGQISEHYHANFAQRGAKGTFLASTNLDFMLQDGTRGVAVYVFPKYQLRYAWERPNDMLSMLHLALAKSREDVHKACASTKTGTCCLNPTCTFAGTSFPCMSGVTAPPSMRTSISSKAVVGQNMPSSCGTCGRAMATLTRARWRAVQRMVPGRRSGDDMACQDLRG